jgi:NAD+--asparagine ADP-ribosyltransferase
LKAGFVRVAVISPSPARLSQIKEAVEGALDRVESARVGYFAPDEFIAHLRTLPKTLPVEAVAPSAPATKKTIGYTVRRHKPIATAEERQAKEAMAMRFIAESMK